MGKILQFSYSRNEQVIDGLVDHACVLHFYKPDAGESFGDDCLSLLTGRFRQHPYIMFGDEVLASSDEKYDEFEIIHPKRGRFWVRRDAFSLVDETDDL